MTPAAARSAPAVWTTRHRRLLGRAFDAAVPDLEGAFAVTRRLIAQVAGAIPAVHDGIPLMPLLEHKLAGYNADLFSHVVRLLRADAGAARFLSMTRARRFRFPFRDMYLAEHCVAERLRAAGGRFAVADEHVRTGVSLAKRYRPPYWNNGFEPLEIPLEKGPAVPAGADPSVSTGANVLFIASMNNYLNPMVPVIRRLVETGFAPCVLLPVGAENWPAAAELPRQAKRLTVPGPETSIAPRVFAAQRARYASLWEHHGAEVARCFRVGDVDLWPVIGADVQRFVRDYFPYAIACIELARDLADRQGVASVVLARLRRATECALAAGFRSRAVPVTMILHGHVSNFPERRFDAGGFSGADRVCVWGPQQARQVMESHWPPKPGTTLAVGNPAWDRLIAAPTRDRDAFRRSLAPRLDADPARPWCVLTSQTLTLRQFPDLVGAFQAEPGAILIVKVHPAEDPAWYRDRLATLPTARVLPHAEIDLHDLLTAADLTLTFSSTTNLESLLLGTPVATYVFGDLASQDRAVYLENYGLPLLKHSGDLIELLRAIVVDPAVFRKRLQPSIRAAVADNLANHADARAADRVARLVVELCQLR